MRHRHVVGIAAVAIDAERIRLDDAHVLIATDAGLALAATKPGIGQHDVAGLETAFIAFFHIRPEGYDFADGFVSHRARQRHATILQGQRLAAMTEIVAALPDVQVAVADAGRLHLDQHLRAGRLRRRFIYFLQEAR